MARHNYNGMLISSFALGLGAGLLLNGTAKRLFTRARAGTWHRQVEQTVSYDQNLPDQLERREPAPRPGQPRFGGTGAIGVPTAVANPMGRSSEPE
jgi:hypothetical protein